MASPIGHALTGLAVALGADLLRGSRARRRTAAGPESLYQQAGGGLTVGCMALAAAPDLDLLITGLHRTVTHSLFSMVVVGLATAALCSWTAGGTNVPVRRMAIMCAVAWGSHIIVDWMSADSSRPNGLQILWPFADGWFISGWDIFPGTERRRLLSAASLQINARALVTELVLLGPVILGLWLVRVKALAGLPSELAGSHHPSK